MSGKGSSTHSDKQCQYCNKMFSRKQHRVEHETIHTGVGAYKCEQCDKQFTQKYDLGRHVNSVHKGERPHECKDCGVRFSEKGGLNKHKLIHSGIKPHHIIII